MRKVAGEDVDLIIANAGELLTCAGPQQGIAGDALKRVAMIKNGALAVRDGRIVAARDDAGDRAALSSA